MGSSNFTRSPPYFFWNFFLCFVPNPRLSNGLLERPRPLSFESSFSERTSGVVTPVELLLWRSSASLFGGGLLAVAFGAESFHQGLMPSEESQGKLSSSSLPPSPLPSWRPIPLDLPSDLGLSRLTKIEDWAVSPGMVLRPPFPGHLTPSPPFAFEGAPPTFGVGGLFCREGFFGRGSKSCTWPRNQLLLWGHSPTFTKAGFHCL